MQICRDDFDGVKSLLEGLDNLSCEAASLISSVSIDSSLEESGHVVLGEESSYSFGCAAVRLNDIVDLLVRAGLVVKLEHKEQ